MLVQNSFSSGDTVTIVNNGVIEGMGGNGGASQFGAQSGGNPGAGAGNALYINRATTIQNNSVIAGGGGGGGGASGFTPNKGSSGWGGGGGGGAGFNPGAGGTGEFGGNSGNPPDYPVGRGGGAALLVQAVKQMAVLTLVPVAPAVQRDTILLAAAMLRGRLPAHGKAPQVNWSKHEQR
jgi:hypothetical protein